MAMAGSDTRLDVGALSADELRRVDNPVLKDVLQRVRKQIEDESKGSRDVTAHYSHVNFYSSIT